LNSSLKAAEQAPLLLKMEWRGFCFVATKEKGNKREKLDYFLSG
jgi:hypothetical protein